MTSQRLAPHIVRLAVPDLDRIRLGARLHGLPRDARVLISFIVRCS